MRMQAKWVPAVVFLAAALVVIASSKIPHRVAYDQLLYHSQAIDTFAQQWPDVDLSDYLSATTPGFHLLLGAAKSMTGLSVRGMQIVCAVITVALLTLLGRVAGASKSTGWFAALLVMPFACSMYVFASGAWVLPDNFAWLGVLVMVLLCVGRGFGVREIALAGIVLTALTCTRQIHVWTAGLLFGAAWVRGGEGLEFVRGASRASRTGFIGSMRSVLLDGFGRRCVYACLALIACMPAVLMLVWFYGIWGGLVPPSFQNQYHMANFAGPAFLLAVFGFAAMFFGGWAFERVWTSLKESPVAVVGAALAGVVLAVVPVTTAGTNADYFAGRRTGLWDIAAKLPFIAHHSSPLIVGLAVAGAMVLGAYLWRWPARAALVVIASFVGYGLALAQGGELWQRYSEPFALMMLVVVMGLDGAMTGSERAGNWNLVRRLAPIGPLVLSMLFVGLSVRDLRKPGTQLVTQPAPPAETASEQVPHPRPDSPWSQYMIAHQRYPWKGSVEKK